MRRFSVVRLVPALVLACAAPLAWPAGAGAQTPTDGTTLSGSALYRSYCASCHGTSGKGDGPVAAHLRRPPTDLTRLTARNKGTFPADELERIIDGRQVVRVHGDSDMPIWGDAFSRTLSGSDEDAIRLKIREIVKHLQSLQQGGAE